MPNVILQDVDDLILSASGQPLSSFIIHIHNLLSFIKSITFVSNPDSKVHGANMGSIWVLSAPDGPHVGPMNLAIREVSTMIIHVSV